MSLSEILKMLLLACIILCMGTGCTQEEGDKLPYSAFVVSPVGGITFAYELFEKQIQITSNTEWSVTTETPVNWLTVNANKGLITLKALPNETAEQRSVNLVFSYPGSSPVLYPVKSLPLNRPKDEISIITYNIKDGFAGKNGTTPNNPAVLNRFRDFSKAQNPDIICFQELNGYTPETFKSFAESLSIGHQYTEFFQVASGHHLGISSKYPISDALKVQSEMTHGLLVVTCCNAGFGVSQLNEEDAESKRIQESNVIIENLKSYSATRTLDGTLVCGDLHALAPYDKNIYGNIQNYQTLDNLNSNNYKGIYEILKTPEGENTTNFTGSNYRYDHILVSPGLQNSCVSYGVITDTPTPNISDHFPVKAVIQVTKFKN